MTLQRRRLRWHRTPNEEFGQALFTIRPLAQVNLGVDCMLAFAIVTAEINLVCRHRSRVPSRSRFSKINQSIFIAVIRLQLVASVHVFGDMLALSFSLSGRSKLA